MMTSPAIDNIAFDDDDDDDVVARTGFEPSLDDIDEGIYTNEDEVETSPEAAAAAAAEVRRCSKCCGCLEVTRRELVTTSNEICDVIRREWGPSKMGWKNWSLQFFRDRFPCLKWLPKYRLKQLKHDVISGVTTGLSVLPQGLAYGQIVEVPAQHGLYSSIMGSYTYSVLGGCKDVAVGPSAVVSIVTAEYGTGRAPIPMDYTYSTILAFFTGIILLFMGLFRLGFLFSFISLPVLKAFRVAAGITIFMSRIKKWWGLLGVPRQFLAQLYWTLNRISETNVYDLSVGALCILLLFTFKKLKAMKWKKDLKWYQKLARTIFWILGAERNIIVIVVGGAILYALLSINVPITHTPDIPRGVPWPTVPNFTLTYTVDNQTYVRSFLEIADDIGTGFFFVPMVVMFECISVGKTLGRKGNYKFDYNGELIAMGVSNLLTSLLRGHPITGAFLRSGINFNAGVRTPAGGILAATIVIGSLYVAYPLFYYIPVCTMAATIMMGAIDVCTFHKFGITWITNKIEIIPYLVTFIISLTLGIEFGVFFGVAVQSIISLFHLVQLKMKSRRKDGVLRISSLQKYSELEFWSADAMTDYFMDADVSGDVKSVEIDLKGVLRLDTSTIQSLKVFNERCDKKSILMKLINVQESLRYILDKTKLKYEMDEDYISINIDDCTNINNNNNNNNNNDSGNNFANNIIMFNNSNIIVSDVKSNNNTDYRVDDIDKNITTKTTTDNYNSNNNNNNDNDNDINTKDIGDIDNKVIDNNDNNSKSSSTFSSILEEKCDEMSSD